MKCILLDQHFRETEQGGGECLIKWQNDPSLTIWIHITGPVHDAVELQLKETFKLHQLALNDAKNERHPPKLEVFSDHTFLVFKPLSRESVDIHFSTIQLAIFCGENFLITRTSGENRAIDQLREEVLKNPHHFHTGPGAMATRIMRLFIERYLVILLQLEPRLEELEDGLLTEEGDEILTELIGYKTELKKIRRIFLYHEQILNDLRRKPQPGFPKAVKHELNDAYEHQERAKSLAHLYYELAADLVDGFLSLSTHRLNRIMQVLTIVTVIFVPITFLAGIYGMNFDYMPELHHRSGYFILLGIMATIATTLLVFFRRWKWFS